MSPDRLFMSYAHEDGRRARELGDRLRAEGWDVWTDERIPGGARWAEELHRAIRTCRAFVVLISPDSMHSNYVLNELHVAVDSHRPVVPVMIERAVKAPAVDLLIADRQVVDYTQASTWQLGDVLAALSEAQRGPRQRPTQRRWAKVVGIPLSVVGALLILAGFGGFFWNLYLAASDADPFDADGPEPAIFVLSMIVAFIGMVVAAAGSGLQRWARRR